MRVFKQSKRRKPPSKCFLKWNHLTRVRLSAETPSNKLHTKALMSILKNTYLSSTSPPETWTMLERAAQTNKLFVVSSSSRWEGQRRQSTTRANTDMAALTAVDRSITSIALYFQQLWKTSRTLKCNINTQW
ncbi:Uncharacterized protein APZ42_027693 [Daphnia magna]|uniref:Uncharacterized protein n=1 Tax=Daphnia magna TaxID=35525 RepID=A0A0P6DCA0_9CRUS|nr:Uncharacterized protein APZ42_027693 [Daphnia magna]